MKMVTGKDIKTSRFAIALMHFVKILLLCCAVMCLGESGASAAFSVGGKVQANGSVYVRQTAGGTYLGSQASGTVGTVTAGPIVAQIGGTGTSYTWYNIDWPSAPDGWVADIGLISALPASPTTLFAAGGATAIGLAWTDNANNEQGFKIERKIGAGAWSLYATLGANVTGYADTSVSVGKVYYYRVYAYNAAGASIYYSNEASASPTGSVPESPTYLEALSEASDIMLGWVDNANNEQGFKIERKIGTAGAWSQYAAVGANVTQYTDTSVSVGTTYYYRVYAYNATGPSAFYSTEAWGSPTGSVPGSPTSLFATAGSSGIGLGWVDNANNEQGFKIERKVGSAGAWSLYTTLGVNVTAYTDTGVSAGNTYYYRVYAYNAAGKSLNSNEASAAPVANIPDFIISSITFSPTTPLNGQPFTAYVTVKNQGTASGSAGWLDVWVNQSSTVSCGADGNTWTSVGVLTAGQSKTFTFSMTAPATAGSYPFRAFVDSACQTTESNDGNNQTTLTYGVATPGQLPDFIVTGISLSPASPAAGQSFTANVTVKNQGSAAGDGGWLDVWANQSSTVSCGSDGNNWASIGTLTAGQSKTYSVTLTAPASGGSYTLRAFADSYCQTTESNDGNNQTTLTYSAATPGQLPDFIVTGISLSPASPAAGQSFTANVTVKNQGSAAGDGGWLDVWANQSSTVSCGADGNNWASIGTLTAGQSKTYSVTLTASASGGSYTLRAFADSYCQTPESNDGNNQTTLTYTIGAASSPPDFLVTSVTFNPATPVGGQPFTAYVTVKNQGAGLGNAGWLSVWVNQSSAQSCGANGDQNQSVGTLAAGQSVTKTFNLTTPASGAPWTFRAFADSGCQTAESNDANNQTTVSYGANPVQSPDFIITGITISPTDVKPGDTFTAYVTVKNQGAGSGDGGWMDVWANKSTAASCGDFGEQCPKVGILASGASKTLTVSLTAGLAGLNTLLAFVDSGCQTLEGNEGNNQFSYTYAPAVVWNLEVSANGLSVTSTEWAALGTQFKRAANFLYDATDGQVRLGNISLNSGVWFPDIKLTDSNGSVTYQYGPLRFLDHIKLNKNSEWDACYATIVHELGHYRFDLGDEYTSQAGVLPCDGNTVKPDIFRLCGGLTGRSHCMMELQYYEGLILVCGDNNSVSRGASEYCTANGAHSKHAPINSSGQTASTPQDSYHGKSCWESIKDWNNRIVLPTGDPLPGPCSKPSNDNEPLGDTEGVVPFVTITGP